MKKIIIGAAVAAAAFSFSVGSASAEGGNGQSVCSNSGIPDGYIEGGPETGTWDSPGEGLSIIAREVGGLKGGVGNGVATVCNPQWQP